MSGWLSFFAGSFAPIALSTMGCTEYLTRAFPGLLRIGLMAQGTEASALQRLYAIAVIAIFPAIHVRGLAIGSQVQDILIYMGFSLIIFPILVVMGVFKLRR